MQLLASTVVVLHALQVWSVHTDTVTGVPIGLGHVRRMYVALPAPLGTQEPSRAASTVEGAPVLAQVAEVYVVFVPYEDENGVVVSVVHATKRAPPGGAPSVAHATAVQLPAVGTNRNASGSPEQLVLPVYVLVVTYVVAAAPGRRAMPAQTSASAMASRRRAIAWRIMEDRSACAV